MKFLWLHFVSPVLLGLGLGLFSAGAILLMKQVASKCMG